MHGKQSTTEHEKEQDLVLFNKIFFAKNEVPLEEEQRSCPLLFCGRSCHYEPAGRESDKNRKEHRIEEKKSLFDSNVDTIKIEVDTFKGLLNVSSSDLNVPSFDKNPE